MKKVGRNDPCHCGSGKKLKKCCEGKLLGQKFIAKFSASKENLTVARSMSSLFQATLAISIK